MLWMKDAFDLQEQDNCLKQMSYRIDFFKTEFNGLKANEGNSSMTEKGS